MMRKGVGESLFSSETLALTHQVRCEHKKVMRCSENGGKWREMEENGGKSRTTGVNGGGGWENSGRSTVVEGCGGMWLRKMGGKWEKNGRGWNE